jgi:hypothetical protein
MKYFHNGWERDPGDVYSDFFINFFLDLNFLTLKFNLSRFHILKRVQCQVCSRDSNVFFMSFIHLGFEANSLMAQVTQIMLS